MPTYSWPARKWLPTSSVFKIQTIAQMSQSPFTGATRAATSGQVWTCEATFPSMKNRDAYDFSAFLDGLEGPVNPVWLHDWHRPYVRAFDGAATTRWSDSTLFTDGTGWAEPSWSLQVAVAALPGARSLTISGFPVSRQVFWRGDVIGAGDNLLQVQSDVYSDAGGLSMVPVLPGLRRGVLAATPVIVDRPKVLMRMTPDSDPGIFRAVTVSAEVTIRFIEALDVA